MSASSLKDRITEDMKTALRARDSERLGAVRLLLAAIKQREVDDRVSLDDAQVAQIVDKLIKQRRDSIQQFDAAGRADLVAREQAELAVLSAYLPTQLSPEEVAAEVEAAVSATAAAGPQDMGRVMALLKPRLAGRADLSKVSQAVKARLAQG